MRDEYAPASIIFSVFETVGIFFSNAEQKSVKNREEYVIMMIRKIFRSSAIDGEGCF